MVRHVVITVSVVLFAVAGLSADPIPRNENISMELVAVPIVDVLSMIASQNDLNLVISGEVTGEISMRLDNVGVEAALDAILTAGGYHYYFKDDVIVVREIGVKDPAGLKSQLVTLKHVEPIVAKKALQSRLSEIGQVIILDTTSTEGGPDDEYHTNRILITERPNNIDFLLEMVGEMDVAERMVLIEVKIIETKVDKDRKLGFNWPSQLGAGLSGTEVGSSSDETSTSSTSDNNLGVYQPQSGAWTWGKLSVSEVSMVLDILEQDGNSKLISDPSITTLENHEAIITSETVIPIQTINRFSEGAVIQDIVTFQDEEVGISLRVTPRINDDGRITLDVNPVVEDIIGFSGPTDNQKPITSKRSIKTRVTVDNTETVALGGLYKEDEISTETRVPLLGRIPFLGKLLFTNKSTEKNTTDLIIMIKPTILP